MNLQITRIVGGAFIVVIDEGEVLHCPIRQDVIDVVQEIIEMTVPLPPEVNTGEGTSRSRSSTAVDSVRELNS